MRFVVSCVWFDDPGAAQEQGQSCSRGEGHRQHRRSGGGNRKKTQRSSNDNRLRSVSLSAFRVWCDTCSYGEAHSGENKETLCEVLPRKRLLQQVAPGTRYLVQCLVTWRRMDGRSTFSRVPSGSCSLNYPPIINDDLENSTQTAGPLFLCSGSTSHPPIAALSCSPLAP